MTSGADSASLTYNKANQLTSLTVFSQTQTAAYDAFGWRIKVTNGTTPDIQQYDQTGALLERSGSDVKTNYVWLDGFPVAAIKPTTTPVISAIHTDQIGAQHKATSAAQAVVWSAYFTPFGIETASGSVQQDLALPGQFNVNGSNFPRNGYRDYSTQMGRYAESDLAGGAGGLNRFMFAGNNPLKNIDPWGLCPLNLPDCANPTLGPVEGSGANGRIWPAMMSAELPEGWAWAS
jgi:RHS repeat-associated protein